MKTLAIKIEGKERRKTSQKSKGKKEKLGDKFSIPGFCLLFPEPVRFLPQF
jgi:hypothetical protein